MKKNFMALKKTMLDRRAELQAGIRKMSEESIDTRKGDDIDLAESAYEQEMAYMMKSRGTEELRVLNVAIDKMEKGEYGICEECEETIGQKRLEVMPFVKFCVECQQKSENRDKDDPDESEWEE